MGEAAKLFTRSLMMGLDSSVRKEEFAELTAEDIENLPYAEAVEYLKKRDVIKKVDYDKLSDKMRFRAFTASRINDGKLLERLNAEMLSNVRDGKGLKDFLSLTKTDILDKVGMGPNQGWYWETVYRTNVQTAYNAGRAMGFAEDKPLALELVIIDDLRTSDICRQYAGKRFILPYEHPFWQTHWPPFHFNCRTTVRAIYDESEIPESWSNPKDIEDSNNGFGANPLANDDWWRELESQVRQAKQYGVQGEIEAAKIALGVDGVYGSSDEAIKHKTIKELKKIGNIAKGDEMTFEEADGGNVNPFIIFGGNGYKFNCQACVAAFEARMRGFPVRAKAYDKNSVFFKRLSNNPLRAFINSEGHHPKWPEDNPTKEIEVFMSWKDCLSFVKKTVKRGERYVMDFDWKTNRQGHIISVLRTKKGKLFFYDPQDGSIYDKEDYSSLLEKLIYEGKYNQPKFLRVDDLQLDGNVLKSVVEACDE